MRRLLNCVAVFFFAVVVLPAVSHGEVIDHSNVDGVASLPQATMDAVGAQRWFFTHASVGRNMISGMETLHTEDAGRYQLVVDGVAYNSSEERAADAGTTSAGTIYEVDRGNPGWASKFTIFDNSIRQSGWHWDKVDVAMNKLCYIDYEADANAYINSMAALELEFADTVLVYTTMPLKRDVHTADLLNENILRNEYNDIVREFAIANDKLLFDIADIEAHDLDGNEHTFTHEGETYQRLFSGYTSDGGHLNDVGQRRVALGWYATAAALTVPEPGTLTLFAVSFFGMLVYWKRR